MRVTHLPTIAQAVASADMHGIPYLVQVPAWSLGFRQGLPLAMHAVWACHGPQCDRKLMSGIPRPWLRAVAAPCRPGLSPAWSIFDARHLAPAVRELDAADPLFADEVSTVLGIQYASAEALAAEAFDAALCIAQPARFHLRSLVTDARAAA